MRKNCLFMLFAFSLIIISCETTKKIPATDDSDTAKTEQIILPDENPDIQETSDEIIEENDGITENEEVIEEYIDADDVEFIDEIISEDEYLRTIENIGPEETITQQEATDDKMAILQIISELSEIMEKNDVTSWLNYLDQDSKRYYSNPANLRKAQRKLPNRLVQLRTIKDYFENVFIPARKASRVDEIRYISKTEVKAVEVKDDGGIVVYYHFKKLNDKWYVNLPPL